MQDRFKFRVWDKPTGQMFYDVALGFIKAPLCEDWVCVDTPEGQMSYTGLRLKDIIIMQCTGLKDKNGKLIYDLDYLQIKNTRYLIKMNIFNISLTNILTGDIIYLKDDSITSKSEVEGNYYECDTKISENAKGGIN